MGPDGKMTREEILAQLPEEFEKLSLLGKVTGPPSAEDYQPITKSERKPFFKTLFEKFNPFVPIGLAATVFFLGNGLRHMVNKNAVKSQIMMRGRVMAQSFTVIALVGGMYYEAEKRRRKEMGE